MNEIGKMDSERNPMGPPNMNRMGQVGMNRGMGNMSMGMGNMEMEMGGMEQGMGMGKMQMNSYTDMKPMAPKMEHRPISRIDTE